MKNEINKKIDFLIADMYLEYKLLEVQLKYLINEKTNVTNEILRKYDVKS